MNLADKQFAEKLAHTIASSAETLFYVRNYESPRNTDPELTRRIYVEWLKMLIDKEMEEYQAQINGR